MRVAAEDPLLPDVRALVLAAARSLGMRRISLETGTDPLFEPAV